jgi:hypothetical protein
MTVPLRHEHRCACGAYWNCADTDCQDGRICDQCEADLYWNARAPEDVRDEQDELDNITNVRCRDERQRELEF